eukprot:GFUD01038241.1.p1 GENE.GFUD01038241.1~~GFUD01038241.1.p1  ORF type:complete len:544 (+),score=116.82 GFUD01038241.1:56-1687(+)
MSVEEDKTVVKISVEDRPIQIVKIDDESETHNFILDEEALNEILGRDEIRDKPICIISVAGAFRKGKSFLLNFMLRYLENQGSEEWMGPEEGHLDGFHWRGGMERDTTGILMWSKIFLVKTPTGREVAVALVDTQGSFDKNSTVRDCATIFALSLMTSSVLVYNLFNNIQEDDLQHLHYFTEYGRLALEDSGQIPFQKLQFLVRDWQYPYEEPYGSSGGDNVLKKQLKVEEKQHPELQALRKGLSSCFSDMSNFLLPHPGRHVATNPNFKGNLNQIDEEFIEHIKNLMPSLLSSRNLVVKAMGGKEVKAKEIVQYYKSYMEIFKGNTMPEPKSMLEVTIEANNLVSLASAKELYMASMESLCGGEKPYLNEQVMDLEHNRIVESALAEFDIRKKLGGEEFSLKYRDQLMSEIDESYNHYKAHNDSKNIFKAANTPITLFVMWSVLYIFSQVTSLLMLYPLANLANLLMWGLTFLGATWAYAKYSGEFSQVGVQIEDLTGKVWDNCFQPILNKAVEQGSEIAVRQAVTRLNSVSSPYPDSKKKR